MNTALGNKIDQLASALKDRPDIGLIQAGSEYRIVNRSTGETLETCYTEDYASKALEQYRENILREIQNLIQNYFQGQDKKE